MKRQTQRLACLALLVVTALGMGGCLEARHGVTGAVGDPPVGTPPVGQTPCDGPAPPPLELVASDVTGFDLSMCGDLAYKNDSDTIAFQNSGGQVVRTATVDTDSGWLAGFNFLHGTRLFQWGIGESDLGFGTIYLLDATKNSGPITSASHGSSGPRVLALGGSSGLAAVGASNDSGVRVVDVVAGSTLLEQASASRVLMAGETVTWLEDGTLWAWTRDGLGEGLPVEMGYVSTEWADADTLRYRDAATLSRDGRFAMVQHEMHFFNCTADEEGDCDEFDPIRLIETDSGAEWGRVDGLLDGAVMPVGGALPLAVRHDDGMNVLWDTGTVAYFPGLIPVAVTPQGDVLGIGTAPGKEAGEGEGVIECVDAKDERTVVAARVDGYRVSSWSRAVAFVHRSCKECADGQLSVWLSETQETTVVDSQAGSSKTLEYVGDDGAVLTSETMTENAGRQFKLFTVQGGLVWSRFADEAIQTIRTGDKLVMNLRVDDEAVLVVIDVATGKSVELLRAPEVSGWSSAIEVKADDYGWTMAYRLRDGGRRLYRGAIPTP